VVRSIIHCFAERRRHVLRGKQGELLNLGVGVAHDMDVTNAEELSFAALIVTHALRALSGRDILERHSLQLRWSWAREQDTSAVKLVCKGIEPRPCVEELNVRLLLLTVRLT